MYINGNIIHSEELLFISFQQCKQPRERQDQQTCTTALTFYPHLQHRPPSEEVADMSTNSRVKGRTEGSYNPQARRHWGAGGAMPPPIIRQTCFWRRYKRSLI